MFNSAAELFIGDAFIWYKSIKHSVNSWQSLVDRLKRDFFHSDHEDNIWDQIKQRKQKRNESVAVFIAHLQILFSRLSNAPAESTKIKHIRKNLLPDYITQLALVEVNTVDELSKHCRKLEEASYLRSKQNISELNNIDTFGQGPHTSGSANHNFENKNRYQNSNFNKNNKSSYSGNDNKPNLNKYKTVSKETGHFSKTYHQKNDNPSPESNTSKILCWNCDMPNHISTDCRLKRKKFCYKCGVKNVKSSDCPKCSKNEQR